mgnify:CR=1 FL=1
MKTTRTNLRLLRDARSQALSILRLAILADYTSFVVALFERCSTNERHLMNQPFVVFATRIFVVLLSPAMITASQLQADEFRSIPLRQNVNAVQPMTGIVLWTTNEDAAIAPIQLEYAYMTYAQIVNSHGEYDWSPLEETLKQVAGRGHQLILRWHDTYVGEKTGVPESITRLANYKVTQGKSENKPTEFPDWSHPELRRFVLEFFSHFAEKYDYDAFPAVNDVRSLTSLKGLLPGEDRAFDIAAGGSNPTLTIDCDRLVPGQRISFAADLK